MNAGAVWSTDGTSVFPKIIIPCIYELSVGDLPDLPRRCNRVFQVLERPHPWFELDSHDAIRGQCSIKD